MYGWIIDIDHLPDEREPEGTNSNAKGVVGPHDIPDWMEAALKPDPFAQVEAGQRGAHIFLFQMYDDDGELYYTGRMITEGEPDDEACAGPLDDFGRPNAGATEIRYPGHPEMNI